MRDRRRMMTVLMGGEVPTVTLPQNLIISDGALWEGFETTTDWTVASGARNTNTSEVISGTQSVKVTPTAGTTSNITKTVVWDMSSAWQQARIWVYLHNAALSDYNTTMPIVFKFYSTAFSADYWYAMQTSCILKSGWNLFTLPKNYAKIEAGAPNWAAIIRMRVQVSCTAAAVAEISADDFRLGYTCQPAVMFRFDDGVTSQYEAYQYMKSRNVRGTLYQIGDWVDDVGLYTTTAQLQEMHAAGWTIGNHTQTHPNLTTLTQAQQEADLAACSATLAAIGIQTGYYVCYPGGAWNADTRLAMTALGMRLGASTQDTVAGALATVYRPIVLPNPDLQTIGCTDITTAITLATAQGYADQAKAAGTVWCPLFHSLGTGGITWSVADFRALVDYCISIGLPFITMDDYYKLQSGPVRIPVSR